MSWQGCEGKSLALKLRIALLKIRMVKGERKMRKD
jgi:hypothetical protein